MSSSTRYVYSKTNLSIVHRYMHKASFGINLPDHKATDNKIQHSLTSYPEGHQKMFTDQYSQTIVRWGAVRIDSKRYRPGPRFRTRYASICTTYRENSNDGMAAPVAHARLRRAPSLRLQGGTQRSSTVVALQSGPLMHIMRLPGPVFSTVFFFWYSHYAYFGFNVPPITSS